EPPVTVGGTAYLCNGVRLHHRPNDGTILYIFYPESLWRDARWEAVRPSLILGAFAGLASVVLTFALGLRLSRRIGELVRRSPPAILRRCRCRAATTNCATSAARSTRWRGGWRSTRRRCGGRSGCGCSAR